MEAAALPVAVFWDHENVRLPSGFSPFQAASFVREVALRYGYCQSIKAYMDTELERSGKGNAVRSGLQSSGVSLIDTPHAGSKDVADKMLLVDIFCWCLDNKAPATIILISGDRDFAYGLSTIRNRRYKVVLICPNAATLHLTLKSQADEVLDWRIDVLKIPPTIPTPKFKPPVQGGKLKEAAKLAREHLKDQAHTQPPPPRQQQQQQQSPPKAPLSHCLPPKPQPSTSSSSYPPPKGPQKVPSTSEQLPSRPGRASAPPDGALANRLLPKATAVPGPDRGERTQDSVNQSGHSIASGSSSVATGSGSGGYGTPRGRLENERPCVGSDPYPKGEIDVKREKKKKTKKKNEKPAPDDVKGKKKAMEVIVISSSDDEAQGAGHQDDGEDLDGVPLGAGGSSDSDSVDTSPEPVVEKEAKKKVPLAMKVDNGKGKARNLENEEDQIEKVASKGKRRREEAALAEDDDKRKRGKTSAEISDDDIFSILVPGRSTLAPHPPARTRPGDDDSDMDTTVTSPTQTPVDVDVGTRRTRTRSGAGMVRPPPADGRAEGVGERRQVVFNLKKRTEGGPTKK